MSFKPYCDSCGKPLNEVIYDETSVIEIERFGVKLEIRLIQVKTIENEEFISKFHLCPICLRQSLNLQVYSTSDLKLKESKASANEEPLKD